MYFFSFSLNELEAEITILRNGLKDIEKVFNHNFYNLCSIAVATAVPPHKTSGQLVGILSLANDLQGLHSMCILR